MKKIFLHFLPLFLFYSFVAEAYSGPRLVTSFTDISGEGTLRTILKQSCIDSGDDVITFDKTWLPEMRILLTNGPLVIPKDCRGRVTIKGSDQVSTIIDGSRLSEGGLAPGDSCVINVYSNHHTLQNLTFEGNKMGAGICFFGRNNESEENKIIGNKYGVVVSNAFSSQHPEMDGSENMIHKNQITGSLNDGVWIEANRVDVWANVIKQNGNNGIRIKGSGLTVKANEIIANGGCSSEPALSSQPFACLEQKGAGGVGILIESGSQNIDIVGGELPEFKNTIQYNQGGGVVILGDSWGIKVSRNSISKNYDSLVFIDLNGDDITPNHLSGYSDVGPNHLLNHPDYLQSFPLVKSPNGPSRYWTWGIAREGSSVELYGVSSEDSDREIHYGGGDLFLGDASINAKTFQVPPHLLPEESAGTLVTTLAFDGENNTSEYSYNFPAGADEDLDGIPDFNENGDGNGSLSDNVDTDGDGLADSVEDKNRNGIWEPDLHETSAYNADSDGDGLPDGIETHNDGIYDLDVDTDPLNPDTDGDGVLDGEEDKNHNGIYEAWLKESNPLSPDSDGDKVCDGPKQVSINRTVVCTTFNGHADTCPYIYNPGQEPWYCTF